MKYLHLVHVLLAALVARLTESKTCLLLYQMADNNLEYFLRQDYEELTNSEVVSKTDELRTWIYYDALNSGGQALPNTVDQNGQELTARFTGSRYVTYDGGRMRVDKELEAERNSDIVATVQAFLEHGMADCLANGFDSLMAVFSSHGGGVAGYGGDENQRRNLLQTNVGIVTAIQNALDNTANAPDKLEVIGFDACLMQAMGAADDYRKVAQYILASEAVEPGHGWAYNYWTDASSALALAEQAVTTFVEQKQGDYHQSPKVLSILDTAKFEVFVGKLEVLFGELYSTIGQDESLNAHLARARSSAVVFDGILDAVGTEYPSALDIGSFLTRLQELCLPASQSALGVALSEAIAAYNEMWVKHQVGAGTSQGTGMHINWPNQAEYQDNLANWNYVLFTNSNYVTEIIPNYRTFLEYYLEGVVVEQNVATSVCGTGVTSETTVEGALIYSTATTDTDDDFTVTVEISPDVTHMNALYGVNLTTWLLEKLSDGYLEGVEAAEGDFLFLKHGDLLGTYDASTFTTTWNKRVYFLHSQDSDTREKVRTTAFVKDEGQGARRAQVVYFPEASRENATSLTQLDFFHFNPLDWREKGALPGFLTFSVDDYSQGKEDDTVHDNLILFAANSVSEQEPSTEDGIVQGTFSQIPYEEGGLIVPLVRVVAQIGGRNVSTIPGGPNHTIIEWNEEFNYFMVSKQAETIFDVTPSADSVIMGIIAHNFNDRDKSIGPDTRPPPENVRIFNVYTRDGSEGQKAVGSVDLQGQTSSTEDEEGQVFESSNFGKADFSRATSAFDLGFQWLGPLWIAFATLGW